MNVRFEGNTKTGKDEWLTPPELINSLGEFDLDPYSPINKPWDTAKKHYTVEDNGLLMPWHGRVFCNPPYDTNTLTYFLEKCAFHKNAIAIIYARTETKVWQNTIFKHAVGCLFVYGRLKFYHVDGTIAKNVAGAPSVLLAFDKCNAETLNSCNIKGHYVNF